MKNKQPNIKTFIHFDKPPTKQRGRGTPVFKGGKYVSTKVWTPAATKKNMSIIANAVAKLVTDPDAVSVFKLKVVAIFKRPVTLQKKLTDKTIVIGKGGSYGDWDNIGKIVSDALNNIVWKDDAQVGDGRSIKVYAKKEAGEWQTPGLSIEITRLQEII